MECKLKNINGMTVITIDDEPFVPLAFKSFRPTKRNVSDFYKAGIRLFNILTSGVTSAIGVPYSLYGESWIDDDVYDFDPVDRQIDLFVENAPEAYFSLMIQLDTRKWWLDKYEGYPYSFRKMSQMEADPYWREKAANYMQAMIRHVEEKYKDKFYGYFLLCGTTTEWFSDYSNEEPTPLVEAEFKKWCGSDEVNVPEESVRETHKDIVFLDCEKEETLINYRKFGSWQRSDTVLYFAKKAQEVLQHKKLLGIYYGYVLELIDARLWNTAHLDYERVFLSDDIDMISSPVSYPSRQQDGSSHQMLTGATLGLRNKLYFIEHDHTTCIVPDYIEGFYFAHRFKVKTIEEDVNLLRRDYMMAVANGCATWWFDMLEGWFYDDTLMGEITNMISISQELFKEPYKSVSEVAIIVDPESLYYVNKNSYLNTILFRNQRPNWAYMGAPYDVFSSCDIDMIDRNQYKCFIFMDQFKKNPKSDAFIDELKKLGKALLFVYAYNVIDKKYDVEKMSSDLGIRLTENPVAENTMILNDGVESVMGHAKTCFAIDEEIPTLGYYKNSGKAAFGYKKEGDAVVAFSGFPNMQHEAVREILKLAGVHIYTESADAIVYVSNAVLGVYHREQKDAVIHVPEDGEYIDLFNNRKKYVSENGCIYIPYDNHRGKLLKKI